MPNVFITNKCNLRCTYCFAKGMLGSTQVEEMSMEEVKSIAGFIKRQDVQLNDDRPRFISILGGEPTLHSNFKRIINYLLKSGFVITMFSNGTFSRDTSDFLGKLPTESINIILNINKRENYTKGKWGNIQYNLKNLHSIIALGFTIFETDFDYEMVLRNVNDFDLKRNIRLGISMPIVNASNAYVAYPEYKQIAKRILKFAKTSFKQNIVVGFDCGFVLCMFSRRELGRLKLYNTRLNFVCEGAIDIGKNERVWRCFPLHSIHNTKYGRFDNITALRDYYNDLLPVKVKGVSGSCGSCKHYIRHNCSGGCYGYEFR